MARRSMLWPFLAAVALTAPLSAAAVHEVVADPPGDLSVTVYRSPARGAGSFDLDDLEGFALIRETRTVRIPAGESRIRFEGVADGIEPVSAIITGLPTGIVEKNRDARLLSPASLVAAAAGKPVTLVRSIPKTGKVERVPGTILSSTDGVVFQTEAGIEALHCSGLPETFTFTNMTGLSSKPTLSVIVRTSRPMTRVIMLSYLARGFDWGANYTATLSANGRTMDLGAWVTLANANGVGFPAAHAQVVAGRLNREADEDGDDVEPIDIGGPVLAECWPLRSTSSDVQWLQVERERLEPERMMFKRAIASNEIQEVIVTGARVTQEQLGDLKLYRVPERTTVASRQSKQVRLLDRTGIPVRRIYALELMDDELTDEEDAEPSKQVSVWLRTQNNRANRLGLPLPSGSVALFGPSPRGRLLLSESGIRDLAVDEEVEINAGVSNDVWAKSWIESQTLDPAHIRKIPLIPGVVGLRWAEVYDARRCDVSNARDSAVQFELRLQLADGDRVIRADHPVGRKNGRPVFNLTVPPHRTVTLRYQTAREEVRPVRE